MLCPKRFTLVEEVTLLSTLSLVLLVKPAFLLLHHQTDVCVGRHSGRLTPMKDTVVRSCLDPIAILSAVTNIKMSSSAGNRTPILWPVLIAVFTELFGSYLGRYAVKVSAKCPTIPSFSCVPAYSPDECCHSGVSPNRSRLFIVKISSLAILSNLAVILVCKTLHLK